MTREDRQPQIELPLAPFRSRSFSVRQAKPDADRAAIHALNHRIFAEELGQYRTEDGGQHVDKFDEKNRYFLAENDSELIGMVAVHGEAPFSFTNRLPASTSVEELAERPLEVRLLAVVPEHRGGRVAAALFLAVHRWAVANRYDALFISGVDEQLPLYRRLGFEALGPAVPQGHCRFTAMRLPLRKAPAAARATVEAILERPLSFLPGPPEREVDPLPQAWHRPLYHRSAAFQAAFEDVRARMRSLLQSDQAALFAGSGTTANDAVACSFKQVCPNGPGWVLSSGEFGNRLADQARRAGHAVIVLRSDWGKSWTIRQLERAWRVRGRPAWIWATQVETSTGVLHPAQELVDWARERDVLVAIDAISSVGAVEAPQHADWITTTSGKCLGGLAGVAGVGVSTQVAERLRPGYAPDSLDLAAALATQGPRHTFPHLELLDLQRRLQIDAPSASRYASLASLGAQVRAGLRALECQVIADEEKAAPCITSFVPPAGYSADAYRLHAAAGGFALAGHSHYLQSRGWLQIATMGKISADQVAALLAHLGDA